MKKILLAIGLTFAVFYSVAQSFRINEVMSSNGGALADMDGETSDWIEFFNSGTSPINLNGFGLSDNKENLFQWLFSDYTVKPGEYLLVFASGKDRREVPVKWNTIVSIGDDWKYLVPTFEPSGNWRLSSFNDNSWNTGKSGFGMGDNDDATIISVARSVFLRKKITVDNPTLIRQMILHMDYDDGFVAYLNGVEIARAQMDGKGTFPLFNATASAEHEALIYQSLTPEKFVINNLASTLKSGENILAIQVHNIYPTSADFSAIPFLSVGTIDPPEKPRKVDILKLRDSEYHTNFKLNADGESLYLTSPSGVIADSVGVPQLQLNYSFGRSSKDSTIWGAFSVSTPGKINSGLELSGEIAPKPVFNLPGGIYPSSVKVSINAPNPKDTIYFTLDGSIPTKLSARLNREIELFSTKVVKARIIKSGMMPGEVVTNSYIIYGNKNLPVVSISMNPADLWDYYTGIYVKGPNAEAKSPFFGANFWMDWEKPSHFELFETSGNKVIDVDAGVKIFGNYSRANEQRSLAFYCRKVYGFEEMNYKIFKERPYDKYKNIILRNSGNDWNNTMFRDGLMTGLTLGLNMEQQAFRPAIIFLNGEYWGIQNIREKINEHMIAQHNDIDPDEVILLENNGTSIVGSAADYKTMTNFLAANSLVGAANYAKMLEWIDVNSFIDYFSSQIYFRNHDWPGNNIRYWKKNDATGRWRWILYDTDFGMGIWDDSFPTDNSLAFATDINGPNWPNPPWSTLMLRKLLENYSFRDQFVNRFADLLNSNFRADNVNKAIDLKRATIVNEIDNHLKKWNGYKDYWNSRVLRMKDFATARPSNVFNHIRLKFNFQNPQVITAQADSLQGLIQLNSLKLSNFPWRGSYFPDVPITLTALPKVGYRFVKWTGITAGSNLATVTVVPQANMVVSAVFEKDGNHYEDIVINEISFNNAANANPGDWIELTNKGTFDIDISGWKITDSDPNHQFIFPANTWLKANEYLVLSNDLTLFNTVFSGVKNLTGPFSFGLSTTFDAVKLYSHENQLIDQVNYKNTDNWQTYSLDVLWSLELINPSYNNDSGLNWVLSEKDGTPGMRNTPFKPTLVNDLNVEVKTAELLPNYPNPFSNETTFEFKLHKPGSYQISVIDINGNTLRIFKGNDPLSLFHTVLWDGRDRSGKPIPSGIYFYKLETNRFSEMKRMVKVK